MVPLPVPEGVTVHQDWSLTTVQAEFEVTVKGVDPAGEAGTFWFEGVTVSDGPLMVPVMEISSIQTPYPYFALPSNATW